VTPTPATAELWHLSEPALKEFSAPCVGEWLLLGQQTPYQGEWLALKQGCLPLREHWLALEEFLQASTTYGPSKAIRELAAAISSHGALYVYSVVCSPLGEIDELIESSRRMLELEEDWDGEGASPIAESTWQRAAEFLRNAASTLRTVYGRQMESPSLVPVPDGSIDLRWKLSNRELLINIPATEDKWASYYGDNKQDANIVKGTLHTEAGNSWLFVWLTE